MGGREKNVIICQSFASFLITQQYHLMRIYKKVVEECIELIEFLLNSNPSEFPSRRDF